VAAIKRRDRNRVEPAVMAAQTARLVGNAGCHWLTSAVEMAARAGGSWPHHPDSAAVRWSCFPGVATPTPGVGVDWVRAARDFTVSTLRRWDVAERREDIAVVVSELLTNAVRHALPACSGSRTGWPIRLGLLQPGHWVMCAVADPSQAAPVPKNPESFAETGRGLHVIAALSDQWGYTTPTDMGKVLWAMFSTRLTPRPPLPRPRPGPQERHAAGTRP
jgi:anti-sigma regulatory factor (Ser/Thr protein kinase)